MLNDPYSLEGKVALVTGAARGIGRAIGDAFINAGATHVQYADILEGELSEIEVSDRRSAALLDVTKEENWQSVISSFIETHGRLDILINNAGVLIFNLLVDTTEAEFSKMLDVNVKGVFLGLRTALPRMKEQRHGVVINTSSANGILPSNFVGAYSATKWAVRGLTRAAALEAGPDGIRVCSVHPGGVNTPMTNPTGASQDYVDKGYYFVASQRGCQPDEIAHGVTYLASDAAAYCNGTELQIDGGLTAGLYYPGLPGAPYSAS